jgi:putative addiction module CopG family antidote
MDVHLTESGERFVRSRVESGDFRSGDEVVDVALRLLERSEKESGLRTGPPSEAEFEARMVAAGLLDRIPPPRDASRSRAFDPIRIEGEPLSETVIRERR